MSFFLAASLARISEAVMFKSSPLALLPDEDLVSMGMGEGDAELGVVDMAYGVGDGPPPSELPPSSSTLWFPFPL